MKTFSLPAALKTRTFLALSAALALAPVGDLRADAPPTALAIRSTGTDFEGLQQFELAWNAVSNANYSVQVSTNLEAGSWETIELVTPAGITGSCQLRERGLTYAVPLKAKLYRLVLPQPQIFAVEPAIFPPAVAVDAFVTGQCFQSNDVVRVDGVPVAGVVYSSPNQFHGPLPALSAGLHLVELVRGGVVKSSFTVTCADPVANPELVLQGPPSDPPASPIVLSARSVTKAQVGLANVGNNRSSGGGGDGPEVDSPIAAKGIPVVDDFRYVVNHKRVVSGGGGGVLPFTGEVRECAVDLAIPGRGLDFIWARTYHSRIGRAGAPNGWTFSYDVNIQPLGGDILIHNGTGRADTFRANTNGVYTCPEFFSEGTLSNNVFTLTFADTGYWEFNPLTAAADAGKLAKIVDRNGNTMTLSYDTSGRLAQIVDDLGRTNTVAYNPAGQLASVTDFSGRTVSYQYYQGLPADQGSAGDLKSVTSPPVTGTPNGNDYPTGKTITYTYSTGYLDDRENHLLLSVIDASGQTIYQHVYQHNQTDLEFLRCISVQHWTNTPTLISYLPQTPTPANGFATLRCIVNDPVGDVSESFSDARGRCVKVQEFAGRATPGAAVTATVNRPTGKLRSSDPDVYESRMSWNNDSLCMAEISPGGQQVRCVYQSDFDSATPARKRADCRVVREIASSPVDFDGDGVADASERVWRFEYDPRFGSPVPNGVAINQKGTGAEKNRIASSQPRIIENQKGLLVDFCVSATDPRGNVTTASYDAKGRRQRIDLRMPLNLRIPVVFAHNPQGQIIALTNAPDANGRSRVDTFSYYGSGPQAGYLQSCVVDAGAGGLALTENYEYDARGNLARYIDPQGNDWLYTYNALDQCVQEKSPPLSDGNSGTFRIRTQFAYDANDNLTLVAEENLDATGTPGTNAFWRTQFIYDAGQRLTACWRDKNGALVLRCNQVAYNAADQVVLYRSPEAVNGNDPTNTVAYEYDERGLLFREIGAPGLSSSPTNEFSYTPNGSVATKKYVDDTTAPPLTTRFEYDGFEGFDGSLPQFQGGAIKRGNREIIVSRDSAVTSIQGGIKRGNREVYEFLAMRSNQPIVVKDVDNFSASRLKVWQLMQGQNGTQAMRSNKPIVTKDVDNITQAMRSNPPIVTKDVDNITQDAMRWTPLVPKPKEPVTYRLKVWQLMQGQSGVQAMRVSKITDPMGNVTTCNYDANDNLKVVTHFGETNDVPGTNGNVRLAESRYDYDGLDCLTTSRDAHFNLVGQTIGDGYRTTTFAYAPNGQCTSMTDDLGRLTTFTHDSVGWLSAIIAPSGKADFSVFRDGRGNVTRCTQTDLSDLGGSPQVFTWTNVFDALARCVSTVDNVGNSNSFAYDSRGNCVRTTDAKGNETVCDFDGLSRCVAVTTYQGAASTGFVSRRHREECDDNDRCISSTDANDNVTLHAYDSLNRCVQTTQADGTHNSLVWSPRSNLIQETDANGTVITHTYDANDRCISNHITPGAGVASTPLNETFAYDGSSRLVAAVNDAASCAFSYDSLDNCVSETRDGLVTASIYDALGHRLSLTYPGGRILTYAYNALDRCTNILESSASLVSFDYDSPDRLAKISYANGMRTRIFYDGISGTANVGGDFGHGQVSRVLHAMNGGSPKISELTFAWDRNGNKLQRTDAIYQPAIPRTNTLLLGYDSADRLTEAAVTRGTTLLRDTVYGLDIAGNRTNVTGAAGCSGSYTMSATLPPGDSQMNRYTTTPCDTRSYDANGNLISRVSPATGPTSYQYDFASRLVAAQVVDFSSGAPVVTTAAYAYDALGRRISKSVSVGALPPLTTDFLFDGNSVIEERNGTTTSATYVRRDDGVESDQDCGGPCLAMRRGAVDYFFHTDDQGNILALTTTGGTVVERYDYDDYGAVTFLTSDGVATSATSSAVGNPYCWHGLRLEAETGLHNDDGGSYFEPQSDCLLARREARNGRNPQTGKTIKVSNNPWSGGGSGGVFSKVPRSILKSFFETGDKPTQGQFSALIDSMVNYPDDRFSETVEVRVTNAVGTSTAVSGGR